MGVWQRDLLDEELSGETARNTTADDEAADDTVSRAADDNDDAADYAPRPDKHVEKGASRVNIAIIAAICLIAVVAAAVGYLSATHAEAHIAVVHDADGNTYEMPLDQDATQTVATDLGTNVVIVESGVIYVSEADCPNHDCIEQGAIDTIGQMIICLPHKMWIEIKSAADLSDEKTGDSGTSGLFDTIGS